VQFVPPIEASVFVNEPAAHAMQAVWPSLPWYWPAAHGAHATVDTLLKWPAGHWAQLVAPSKADSSHDWDHDADDDDDDDNADDNGIDWARFVAAPGGHTAHATVDTLLYRPAKHVVQVVPAGRHNVSVVDPAAQVAHGVVDALVNRPGIHTVQAVDPSSPEKPLAAQDEDEDEEDTVSWSMYALAASVAQPTGQSAHGVVEILLKRPAVHAVHAMAFEPAIVLVT
jgi:hypothetical protein